MKPTAIQHSASDLAAHPAAPMAPLPYAPGP